MELTEQQATKLKKSHADIEDVLRELGVIDDNPKPPTDPQWYIDTGRQWRLLNDLKKNYNADVGSDEWGEIGRDHGYDPRGLGGFFVGSRPYMGRQGARRVLTSHGHDFIERWRSEFEKPRES